MSRGALILCAALAGCRSHSADHEPPDAAPAPVVADCATERGRVGPDDPIQLQLSVERLAKLLSLAAP